MISFGLRLGAVNAGLESIGLDQLGAFVASHIERGSANVIRLLPSASSTVPVALAPTEAVGPLRLHQALAQVLGNTIAQPVRDIGLLFAYSYRPAPGTFGLMFDLGFRTPDDQAVDMFTRVPRQGCVVFLGAIKEARAGLAYRRQVEFTSVHEVGHVFNLIHQNHPLTFMASSEANATFGNGAFIFGPTQTKWLARCATDADVMPGGSPFRDWGFQDGQSAHAAVSSRLTMEVSPSSTEFWPIEPVMLNVRLDVAKRSYRVVIPAEVDPGYRRFRILIRNPDGGVRLYRSPVRFCPQASSVEISAAAPFVRDVPLFGQAGGYTFAATGTHQVWAEFDVTSRTTVQSNVCSINVLPLPRRQPKWAEIASPGNARMLFYRDGEFNDFTSVLQAAQTAPRRTQAMTAYICARAALPFVLGNQRAANWVSDQLKRCLDLGDLPAHQRSRAQASLAQIS